MNRQYAAIQRGCELEAEYVIDSLEMALLLFFSGVALGIVLLILVDVARRVIVNAIRAKVIAVLGSLSGVTIAILLCCMQNGGEVVRGLVLAFSILAVVAMYMFFTMRD